MNDDAAMLGPGKGGLVCTRPFPSMPVGFWNDPKLINYRVKLTRPRRGTPAPSMDEPKNGSEFLAVESMFGKGGCGPSI